MHIIVDAWLNIYTYTHRRILDLLVMCISTMEKMLRGIRLRKQGWDLLASKRGRMSIKTGIKINIDSGITSTGSWWIATWGASQKITGEFHALWISTVSYIPCINHILALGIIQEKTIIMHAIYPKKEPASKTSGGNIIYGDASNYSCWVHDERHISDKTCSVTTKQKKNTTNKLSRFTILGRKNCPNFYRHEAVAAMNFTRGILSPWFPPKGYSTTHIDPPAWTDVAPNQCSFQFLLLGHVSCVEPALAFGASNSKHLIGLWGTWGTCQPTTLPSCRLLHRPESEQRTLCRAFGLPMPPHITKPSKHTYIYCIRRTYIVSSD